MNLRKQNVLNILHVDSYFQPNIYPRSENVNVSGSVGLLVVNSLAFVYLKMSLVHLSFKGYFPWKKNSS